MSVYKHSRTGRWITQVYDPSLGRKRQVGTYATRREAKAAESAEEGKRPRSAMLVTEWRQAWLDAGEGVWKDGTHMHYTERTASFDKTHGKKRLTDINRTIARAWVAEHPSTYDTLRIMFGAARREDNEHGDRLLVDNPFSMLMRKKAPRRDLEADWLRPADIDHLEQCALRSSPNEFGVQLAAMVRFAAETGVRPGELFALEYGDLDHETGVVTVRRAANSKTRRVDTPKNGKGRQIVFSQRAQLAVRSMERVAGTDRLFSTARGTQFWAPSWSYHWKPIRNAFGRPTMTFYELRHYCCTRLLELGIPAESAAIQLGHTDGGELVRRVYGHESGRRALANVRAAMDGVAA